MNTHNLQQLRQNYFPAACYLSCSLLPRTTFTGAKEALLCMASEKTKDYLKLHALGSSGRPAFRWIRRFVLDKSIALVRLARPTARTELPANLAFTLLPFKASFALTTIYKHRAKSSDFDRHLVFFCGHRI